RTIRSQFVLVGSVGVCHARAVLVRKHIDHAIDAQRFARIDTNDPSLCNGGGDHAAVGQSVGVELAGIFRSASDLRATVNTGGGSADVRRHGSTHGLVLFR